MSATSMHGLAESNFPADGSPLQKLKFALKYAALAPTENHWQPWDVRMADTHLELMARGEPELEAIDPDGRELLIGCGAALLYLKLALKYFGCLGRVSLFPDLGNPALVARVHFGFCRERDAQEHHLFKAMSRGSMDGSPLGETPVSETMLAALSHAVAGERSWVDFVQSETSRQTVLKITLSDGCGSRWSRPLSALGGRNVNPWKVTVEPLPRMTDSAATLAVVKTKTDDKHGWLEAGQTMARTILQAQSLSLSWAFFNPVRRREAREGLRLGVGHKGFAQIILRFGPLVTSEMVEQSMPTAAAAMFR
jgi:hypothetical protein